MSSDNIIHIKGDNWDAEVLKSGIPVVVDFWAEWCGPCKALAPILEQIADELGGRIKIAKVDVGENQELASQFGIRSIPTLLVFKGGVVQEQMVGFMSKAELLKKLNSYL